VLSNLNELDHQFGSQSYSSLTI